MKKNEQIYETMSILDGVQEGLNDLTHQYHDLIVFFNLAKLSKEYKEEAKIDLHQSYIGFRTILGELDETIRKIDYFKQLEKEMNNENK